MIPDPRTEVLGDLPFPASSLVARCRSRADLGSTLNFRSSGKESELRSPESWLTLGSADILLLSGVVLRSPLKDWLLDTIDMRGDLRSRLDISTSWSLLTWEERRGVATWHNLGSSS